jgi:hypothetical protein
MPNVNDRKTLQQTGAASIAVGRCYGNTNAYRRRAWKAGRPQLSYALYDATIHSK